MEFKRYSIEKGDLTKFVEEGPRACICPKCKKITLIEVNAEYYIGSDINGNDMFPKIDNIECIHCGEKFDMSFYDMLDPNIAECVKILNDAGFKTNASCEGHKSNDEDEGSIAYISFKDNSLTYQDQEYIINHIPDSWMFYITCVYTKNKHESRYTLYNDIDDARAYKDKEYKKEILNIFKDFCKELYLYKKGEEYDT